MKRWVRILKGTMGETLVEVIVSLVIVTIAFTAFGTCAVTAANLNSRVSAQEQQLFQSMAAAESGSGEKKQSSVLLKGGDGFTVEIPVTVYQGDLQAYSYSGGDP